MSLSDIKQQLFQISLFGPTLLSLMRLPSSLLDGNRMLCVFSCWHIHFLSICIYKGCSSLRVLSDDRLIFFAYSLTYSMPCDRVYFPSSTRMIDPYCRPRPRPQRPCIPPHNSSGYCSSCFISEQLFPRTPGGIIILPRPTNNRIGSFSKCFRFLLMEFGW